ncbi:UDP-N-acetyl glucosamine 2-epimerase [Pusillimonas caeni]|uniref:UDP-N-acetyl glucosamine 2-epimerase n=1 Tax=Pusillimonas caeni TaxID=1348472 RepID=UPI000E59AC5E|nr:UDP-N-acetyl glucosamine 2-epimerase [Pusillimonas caeni]TFL14849.1 UDP-N-acetyl glucosamine 2-epimerase [Pusillimonas caeni]
MLNLITVVGNRPQFVKAAIVARRWLEAGITRRISNYLVHTGQHYDRLLSDVFFEQLGLDAPNLNLHIGSGPVIDQIGAMLGPLRSVFEEQKPDGIVVYGDTNSTVAAAITAAHLHIPIFHVEAGERNYRRYQAPEEVNGIITDELAWMCLTSTEKAEQYLFREGYSAERVRWVGDPMFDLFSWAAPQVDTLATVNSDSLGLRPDHYALATIHRNENTTDKSRLLDILTALDGAPMPVVLPIHPRVRNLLSVYEWRPVASLKIIEPLGYFDLLSLLRDCAICVTDSGGLAREAFFAGKPSIIPMPNSGWNEIVEAGWARVVPGTGAELLREMTRYRPTYPRPEGLFGDGYASIRIAAAIEKELNMSRKEGNWHPLGDFFSIPQPQDRSLYTYTALEDGLDALRNQKIQIVPLTAIKEERVGLALIYLVTGDMVGVHKLGDLHEQRRESVTFSFRPDSAIYNLLEETTWSLLRTLIGQGHQICLELRYSPENMTSQLEKMIKALEILIGAPIAWLSHNNTLFSNATPAKPFDANAKVITDKINRPFYNILVSPLAMPVLVFTETENWGVLPMSPFERKQRTVTARRGQMESEMQLI